MRAVGWGRDRRLAGVKEWRECREDREGRVREQQSGITEAASVLPSGRDGEYDVIVGRME